VCDIVLADRVLSPVETKFVKVVAEYLEVDPAQSLKLLRNIRIKNEHVDGFDPGPPDSIDIDEDSPIDVEFEDLGVMSPQETIYAIHMCAVMADGTRLLVEGVELEALRRIKSLTACTDRLRKAIAKKVWRLGENKGWQPLLEHACRHLPTVLRLSVYGQAVDLTLADLHLHHEEKKFLKDLQKLLGLDSAEALEMFQTIRIKNEH
jgi:uncharacterized tellurite resistance protein B-like protein